MKPKSWKLFPYFFYVKIKTANDKVNAFALHLVVKKDQVNRSGSCLGLVCLFIFQMTGPDIECGCHLTMLNDEIAKSNHLVA